MNASDIIRLLNTNHYAPADLEEVNKLCRNSPEFTTAHLLKVRIMEALGYEKQKQLKIAAVYSMNRKKLRQLVTEAKLAPEEEPAPSDDSLEIIQFSEESDEDADIIIEQHAPYAGPDSGADAVLDSDAELLELEEEEEDELLTLDDDEDPSPDELLSSLEKDETDMEEAETELDETPVIDQVDKDKDKENKNNHLISSFIKDEPGPIRADKETSLKGDVSLSSIKEHDGFITDTLAQIYVKQGLYAKAIYAYEKLSLKYPEKSAYFAAQIEKIKNITNA